jgi:hypothetical protein
MDLAILHIHTGGQMINRALFVLVAVVLAGCVGGEDEAKVQPQVLAMASPAEMAQAPVTPRSIEVNGVKYQAVPEVAAPTMEMAGREMLRGIFQNDMYRFRFKNNTITAGMIPNKYQDVGTLSPPDRLYATRIQYEGKVVPALLTPTATVANVDGTDKGAVRVTIMTCLDSVRIMWVEATSSHFANYHHEEVGEFSINDYPPEKKTVLQEACRLAAQL